MPYLKTILFAGMLLSGVQSWSQYGFDTISVHFDIGAHDIGESQKAVLDSVIFLASGDSRKMLIYGYADYLGTSPPNQALSDRRAESVYYYLIQNDLPSSYIIQYTGAGQISKKNNRNEHGNQDFRKVDIFLKRNPLVQPDSVDRYLTYESPSDIFPGEGDAGGFGHYEKILSLEVGQTLVLNNIHFYMTRSTVLPQSMPYLEELLRILLRYKNLKIKLEGHVCCLDHNGDSYDADRKNSKLSVNRAEAIYDYLVRNGVDASRLLYEGFGRRRPVHEIETTEQQALENRRVEVRIIEK